MKKFVLFILFVAIAIAAYTQEFKESELPAQVASSFKEKFTTEGKVVWTKVLGNFTASFKAENQTTKAEFSPDGKWLQTKTSVEYKELPGTIASYLSEEFKEAKIKESAIRETPEESDHYYITLKKEGTDKLAELTFDLKGEMLKKSIPDEFYATPAGSQQNTQNIPTAVLSAFRQKVPDGTITSWKQDSMVYVASFTAEQQKATASFMDDGTWLNTKTEVSANELPGPVSNYMKQKYSVYKIKKSQLLEDTSGQTSYYLLIKKEGVGQTALELYFSIAGKFIKQVVPVSNKSNADAFINEDVKTTEKDDISNTVETVNIKELPSSIPTYIKENYKGYSIKEAVYSATDEGTYYYVKIKKEGVKDTPELSFDIHGKYVVPVSE
jgi:hypothetical protein